MHVLHTEGSGEITRTISGAMITIRRIRSAISRIRKVLPAPPVPHTAIYIFHISVTSVSVTVTLPVLGSVFVSVTVVVRDSSVLVKV